MRYEVEHFLTCVCAGEQSPTWPVARSLAVARILDRARAQVGVRFPADS
jgi:hypothetical protein